MKINNLVVLDENEAFSKKQKEELNGLAETVTIYGGVPKSDEEAIKRIGNADAIITCWYSVNKIILDACPKMKYLGVVATGYEWVDVPYALQKNIVVTNVPAYATEAVASHIMKQLKKIGIKGKLLGIIGMGNIGSRLAKKAKKAGMSVICWDRSNKEVCAEKSSFNDVFSRADIVALTVKLNDETKGIVKRTQIDLLKESSVIVDVVSPKLFEDLDYLIKKVNSKKLGLILDFDADNNLSELAKTNPKVIYTPHVAWKSKKSIFNLHQIAIDNLKGYIEGKLRNSIHL